MPNLVDMLREMLQDGRMVAVTNGETLLVESEPEAGLKTVCVDGVPAEAIVLRMDSTAVQRLIRSARGENRRCDFTLFLDDQGKQFLVHVELKTGEHDAAGPQLLEKFRGTDSILDYCESILWRFYGTPTAFKGYARRYVYMYKAPSISKMPTRTNPLPANDDPERPLVLAVENFVKDDAKTKVPIRRFVCE